MRIFKIEGVKDSENFGEKFNKVLEGGMIPLMFAKIFDVCLIFTSNISAGISCRGGSPLAWGNRSQSVSTAKGEPAETHSKRF